MNTLTLLAFALFSATLIGPALANGVIDNKGDLLFTKNTTVVGNDGAFLCAAITSSTGIKTKPYAGPPENFTLVFGPKK